MATGRHRKLIKHIVIVVQEGRTFGNLFTGWPNAFAPNYGYTQPFGQRVLLSPIKYSDNKGICELYGCMTLAYAGGFMNGFNVNLFCKLTCHKVPKHPKQVSTYPYAFLLHSEIKPYRIMASRYAIGDNMYATSWGGDFTAHQDIIAGTTFVDKNHAFVDVPNALPWGCDAPRTTRVTLEHYPGPVKPDGSIFPCFSQYPTMADTLDSSGVSWKYYVSSLTSPDPSGKLWNAFDAIRTVRRGNDWKNNVVSPPQKILADAKKGLLPAVSWVIPKFAWSDSPSEHSDKGPSWVAAIVNSIGKSRYWNSTAIIVVWTDWGGWYDAARPEFPSRLKGSGYGFRVPCLIISPYAKQNYVSHTVYEFGSILKFAEETFNLRPLSSFGYGFVFTDQSANSLSDSFDFNAPPRAFETIPAKYPLSSFTRN